MQQPIKIIIADDNRFFCEAVIDSLKQHQEFTAGLYFTTLEDLINYTNFNTFDILILDVNFNGNNSLDHISEIKKETSNFKIIALTTLDNNFIKRKAFEQGVDEFIGKNSDFSKFKDIIIDCYQKPTIKKEIKSKKIIINNFSFTERKLGILEALYKHSDKTELELAKKLNITKHSLKTHKRELFEITNTNNIQDLIKFGIQHGLIIA